MPLIDSIPLWFWVTLACVFVVAWALLLAYALCGISGMHSRREEEQYGMEAWVDPDRTLTGNE